MRCAPIAVQALVLVAVVIPTRGALAQGDGPRVYPLAPVALTVVSGTYMHMSSNFNFQQDILVVGADITSDVGALAFVRNFGLAGRFAQVELVPIFGGVDGTGAVQQGDQPAYTLDQGVSGFADPYVQFRLGLSGAPALELPEFVKHAAGFQVYALLGANVPIGAYEQSRPLNLGTNRWAIRLGVPMVLPLLDPRRPLLLEFVPSIYFYTANSAPFRASERTQEPRLVLETHASYNLTRKLWAGVDFRYQWGAETTTDGVSDDNRTAHGGANVEVGYQLHPAFSLIVGYGGIVLPSDDAKGTMFRARGSLVLPF
jgi:hypothetical protein